MTKNGRNGTPAYKRIQGVIWKRIETGQLKPGDAVDSERELARIHGKSLTTARHALTRRNAKESLKSTAKRGHFCGASKSSFQIKPE